jgi:hypothetical protein
MKHLKSKGAVTDRGAAHSQFDPLHQGANWTFVPGATVGFSGGSLVDAVADPFVAELDALGTIADKDPTVASNGSKMIAVTTVRDSQKLNGKLGELETDSGECHLEANFGTDLES